MMGFKFPLKICSSNAKQMSKYLQLAMGFKEVAYKGLETGSKLIGACYAKWINYTRNYQHFGNIDDDNVLKFPFFQNDLNKFRNINHEYF